MRQDPNGLAWTFAFSFLSDTQCHDCPPSAPFTTPFPSLQHHTESFRLHISLRSAALILSWRHTLCAISLWSFVTLTPRLPCWPCFHSSMDYLNINAVSSFASQPKSEFPEKKDSICHMQNCAMQTHMKVTKTHGKNECDSVSGDPEHIMWSEIGQPRWRIISKGNSRGSGITAECLFTFSRSFSTCILVKF